MKRRSSEVSGCINFPVDDLSWKNTGEGGMLVKLVVCDNRELDDQFGLCCGASVFDVLSESFIGDDRRLKPRPANNYQSIDDVLAEQATFGAWQAYHFPRLLEKDDCHQYTSRDYLAVLVLGSTGWSGWNEGSGEYWMCTFGDLTAEGQALYRQLEVLYKGCDLHLLTFLDT